MVAKLIENDVLKIKNKLRICVCIIICHYLEKLNVDQLKTFSSCAKFPDNHISVYLIYVYDFFAFDIILESVRRLAPHEAWLQAAKAKARLAVDICCTIKSEGFDFHYLSTNGPFINRLQRPS